MGAMSRAPLPPGVNHARWVYLMFAGHWPHGRAVEKRLPEACLSCRSRLLRRFVKRLLWRFQNARDSRYQKSTVRVLAIQAWGLVPKSLQLSMAIAASYRRLRPS